MELETQCPEGHETYCETAPCWDGRREGRHLCHDQKQGERRSLGVNDDPMHLYLRDMGELQLLNQDQIIIQAIDVLTRCSDHHTTPYLKSDFLQVKKATDPMLVAHIGRVEFPVVIPVCRLMTKQISRRTGIKKLLIGFS